MDTKDLYSLFLKSAGVTTDTRNLKKGSIYFAIRGDNFDGNSFAMDAIKAGAMAAVCDDPTVKGKGVIIVPDTLLALQDLSRYHRRQFNIPVLAITGSNGKTTTKELISRVLSKRYKVHTTTGNLNNHIGVPLTLLEAREDTELMVIEMGANHQGEIASLCSIAEPGYGLITNIGKAHIEGFGSIEGIIKGKGELYDWLKAAKGIAIFNESNSILKDLVFKKVVKAVPYSDPTGVDVIVKQTGDSMALNLTVTFHGVVYYIKSKLFGAHNIENIRAALSVGVFFEVDIDFIIKAIESYEPTNNRSQVITTASNTIICDAYNANPSSMYEALKSFSETGEPNKAVIIGDMLEQGERSHEEHELVLCRLKEFGLRKVYLVGEQFGYVNESHNYPWFATAKELVKHLHEEPLANYTILVKGSRGIGLEKVFEIL